MRGAAAPSRPAGQRLGRRRSVRPPSAVPEARRGMTRAPAPPRRGHPAPRSPPRRGLLGVALEIAEEHVAAEPPPPRTRLDLHQVDPPARRTPRGISPASPGCSAPGSPEQRATSARGAVAPSRRGGYPSRRRTRQPHEARLVVLAVLTPSRSTVPAVDARRQQRPERRLLALPRLAATILTASAVEDAGSTARGGSSERRKRVHWPGTCGCVSTVVISAELDRLDARSASGAPAAAPRPRSRTSPTSSASRSRVTLTEPSSEFSIGTIAHSSSPARSAITVS